MIYIHVYHSITIIWFNLEKKTFYLIFYEKKILFIIIWIIFKYLKLLKENFVCINYRKLDIQIDIL